MTRGESFENSFWESDFTGSIGWERLVKRMKDGRKVCQDVAHFLKERARAEAEYSKTLLNISKKVDGSEETGNLGLGWLQLKVQTEEIARAHDEAAKLYLSLNEDVVRFNEEQKRVKHEYEETMKKSNKNKQEQYNKTMNLKRQYDGKCRDQDSANDVVATLKQSVTITKKELEKGQSKLDKCQEAARNADVAYKSAVMSLEGCRVNWEEAMETTCRNFQNLETSRMEFLRNKLWEVANLDSKTCVQHDDACEKVRLSLEECDIVDDLHDFIERNRTGSRRPQPIEYEHYYAKNQARRTSSSSSANASSATLPPKRPPALPPTPAPRTEHLVDIVDDDPAYASVNISASQPSPQPSKKLLTVIRPHIATGCSELNVKEGAVVEFIGRAKKGAPGLIQVKIPESRQCGLIHESCVQPVRPARPASTLGTSTYL